MMNKRKNTDPGGFASAPADSIPEDRLKAALDEKGIAGLEEAMSRYYNTHAYTGIKVVVLATFFSLVISIPAILLIVRSSGEKGLFHSYFAPGAQQQITGIYRGLDDDNNTPFLLFSSGKFQKALPGLRSYLHEYPADMQARLMMSICLMEAGNFSEAETELNSVLAAGHSSFSGDAHWYLALIQVRKGNYAQALDHLDQMGGSSIYTTQVQSLKKKLLKKTSRLLTFPFLPVINV